MADFKSQIILARNIAIDKEYTNVLNYTENQMLALVNDKEHYIDSRNDYRFLRPQESIFVDFKYDECIKANYIAFQNKDYSNKWFFAWIDEVIFHSDSNCEIKYTIDAWSTWFDYWKAKRCFVAREHVNDDTIGKHTIPENIDVGQLKCDFQQTSNIIGADSFYWLVIACNFNPANKTRYAGIGKYGNYPQGSMWFAWLINNNELSDGSDINEVTDWIFDITEKKHASDIQAIFALPYQAFNLDDVDMTTHLVTNGRGNMLNEDFSFSKKSIRTFKNSNGEIEFTPKNNKLFTYPYSFMRVSNNLGSYNDYKIEDFNSINVDGNTTDEIIFNAIGVPCQGYSGKLRPKHYQGLLYNEDESLTLGKYPTLSWTSDAFINWLTQNGVNLAVNGVLSAGGSALAIAGGVATANPIAVASGILSASQGVAGLIGGLHQASMLPNTAQGNANAGDLSFAHNLIRYKFMHMRPKIEYLEIIDDYFTRFGYATNRLKKANITGRKIFNYVEIGTNESIGIGSVPLKYMDIINMACRKGVTIWHNHENVGNFELDNSIV